MFPLSPLSFSLNRLQLLKSLEEVFVYNLLLMLGACGWQEFMSLRLLVIEEQEVGKMHDTVVPP